MSWLTRAYEAAPPPIQNLALTLYGWRVRQHRFGAALQRSLDELLESERWPRDRLLELQNRRLRRIVRHAYDNSPFYRRSFDEAGVAVPDIRTIEDLPKLPILTKEAVRANGDSLLTSRPRRGWLEGHTSGTTGSPLAVWYDRRTCVETNAVDARHKRWAGLRDGEWIGLFLGRVVVPIGRRKPPYWRINHALRQVWFSSFHLSDESLPQIVEEIKKRSLRVLEGYPSTLFVVADHLRHRGETLPLRAVITSSETLHRVQRETIERAFRCPLFDFYAMAERTVFAGECEFHEGKHVAEEYGVLEIVDANGEPVAAGDMGYVVGTSLHNTAMPMLRYRMSDVTSLLTDPCPCGRTLMRMSDVSTKAEDIVVTPDGRWISPSVLTHPFKPLHSVTRSQIVQLQPDHVVVKIVPDGEFPPSERRQLLESLTARLGREVRIDIEVVDDIPRDPSGKFRWVVSRIPHDLRIRWT